MDSDKLIKWLQRLKISEGPKTGKRIELMPYQLRFLDGLASNSECGLSMGRANGKTTLSAAIAAAGFLGPLSQPRGQVIFVASSLNQARIGFTHTLAFLKPFLDKADPKRWSLNNHIYACKLEDREKGTVLRAIGSDPKHAHGLAPSIAILDEPAQWKLNYSEELYAAMTSSLGKQRDSKLIAVGTRSDDPEHWFSELFESSGNAGVYGQLHTPSQGIDEFSLEAIRAANPAYGYFPMLREKIKEDREKAMRKGGRALRIWRALRLNMGTAIEENRESLVAVENWEGCKVNILPAKEGPVALAFDLGGSSSMTTFASYWPECGRLEVFGAFPSDPDLAERGVDDQVGNRYLDMLGRNEIVIYPGKVTPVERFLTAMKNRIEGEQVLGCVADRYRQAEAEQAMALTDIRWNMEWRASGTIKSGSEDIRAFQTEVLEARINVLPSLMIESALAETIIERDEMGNPKLNKSRSRGRIDAAQAMILAVGLGRRWRNPVSDEREELERFYSDETSTVEAFGI